MKNGEYLSVDDSKYDNQSRNVYTSLGNQATLKIKWELPILEGHMFGFKNTQRNEYLQATEISICSNHQKCNKAIARIGGVAYESAAWDYLPVSRGFESGFKIKNRYFNSFLTTCGSSDSDNVVGTSDDDNSTRFIWQIEEC